MDKQQTPRVVPSGKVYRQLFDAQVQLVNNLERTQAEKLGANKSENVNRLQTGNVDGMLTERQNTWLSSFPNEDGVENPVVYRHWNEVHMQRTMEPESVVASHEVRGLPDVIVPTKQGSDIIERIAESRKQRHEAAVEDMHQELGLISSEIEPRIVEAGEILTSNLVDDDREIEFLLSLIDTDEKLVTYSLEGLEQVWSQIQEHSAVRQQWIEEMDTRLQAAENDRINMIRTIFQSYAATLQKIAHLMLPDLQRLLDVESQRINQTVLSNKRAYADLYSRLMISDIGREKRQHTWWMKRVDSWKNLNIDKAVQQFREFMQSCAVLQPQGADKVLQFMVTEQQAINAKRLKLLDSLSEMKPPSCTKTAIYQWNQQILQVSKQIDAVNQQYFNKLYAEYEEVCQKCLEEVDLLKEKLIACGACNDQKAQEVVNEHCLPLVGERQAAFEKELEEMDKALEEQNQQVFMQLKSLFKYAQGAAHLWDVHEIGLAKQERNLHEKLEECRHKHDNTNQDKEANLDMIMDRMRQDANEAALKANLQKALDMLNNIKNGYEGFHQTQMSIVESYPSMVEHEVMNYDMAVCKFFGVDRTHPDETMRAWEERKLKMQQEEEEEESTPRKSKKKKKSKEKGGSSRASSQASEPERISSPLPMAVSEVLSTAKGTTFYVLTVAGEHGVPKDKDSPVEESSAPKDADVPEETNEPKESDAAAEGDPQTFLTEAPEVVKPRTPAYIVSVDVAEDFVIDIKKKIRMNFLDNLEEWSEQAVDRANGVLAAKTEELNSELDLRLHLHQPRSRRAELDVHNVRAAELVMHNERVSRHCKGINQAITDLKTRFASMTKDHNKLVEKFREDIHALEVIFINATKSAKLISLSNQLQLELDKFMSVIRTSLRQFRQHLDDTLQMLRDSNARFIKSFKLFSDGGNFCPEEIEEYRKRLEKMAQKIDSAEGFIMADLEGMESKRLDQGTKIAAEFQDRFKHHLFDLTFMEKIARWLTNTQVKIKAEVADSNSQAQRLAKFLSDLETKIDACERPNLDKEQVTAAQLNDSLKEIFESFRLRCVYLNCLKDNTTNTRPTSATMQGNPALGARVAFMSDVVPPISKAGKQPAEDASVAVIKNIIKTQKAKLRFGLDAELDGEQAGPNVTSSHQNIDREKNKSTVSRPPTQQGDNKSHKSSSRKGTPSSNNTSETVKRTSSALRRISNKNQKFDKKYLIFGEGDEEIEDHHLLGVVKRVLRESLDGLLTAAEMYYRHKGNRQVTRPQALQETFEQCADIVVQKLQSYYNQTDEYHNQCLQELRAQLVKLESLVSHIPALVLNDVLKQHMMMSQGSRNQLDQLFCEKLKEWNKNKDEHNNQLRPTLGHPHQREQLSALCEQEEVRRQEYITGVDIHTMDLQASTEKHAVEFVAELASVAENLLLQFDNMLTVDDVLKGRIQPPKHSTSELLRRKQAGVPLEDNEDKNALPRGKAAWQGIPKDELVLEKKEGRPKLTASVQTAKTTLGHSGTEKARDTAYQEYKSTFERSLSDIAEQKETRLLDEERWTQSWQNSVQKIKQLY